jgi:hypothetical protein
LTADLVSASSLMLAAVAVIYGLWYPHIGEALNREVPIHREDAEAVLDELRDTLRFRALPLASAALIGAAIFVPDSADVVSDAASDLAEHGFGALDDYDALGASLVAVTTGLIALGTHTSRQALRLSRKIHAAERPRPG